MGKWLVAIVLIASFNLWAAPAEIKVIAVEYPPFTSSNEEGYGIGVKLLNQYLKQRYDINTVVQILPPARAQQVVKSDQWCLSFYPPEEKAKFQFITLSEQKIGLGLYRKTQPTPFKWQHLSEFKGKSIAVLNYREQGELEQLFTSAGLNVIKVETTEQGLRMLARGRLDFVFSTKANSYLDSLDELEKSQFQFSEQHFFEVEIGVYRNPKCDAELEQAALIHTK